MNTTLIRIFRDTIIGDPEPCGGPSPSPVAGRTYSEATVKEIINYLEILDEDNIEDMSVGIFMDRKLKKLITFLKQQS